MIFDNHKLFQRYLLHPRGWQDTKLELSIIGMGRIAKATIDRYAWVEKYKKNHPKKYKDKSVNYIDFTEEIKEKLTFRYPWFGAKGLDPELIKNTKIKDKVMHWEEYQLFKGTPESPVRFGQLIAMIVPQDDLVKFQSIIPSNHITYTKYDWWPIGNTTVEHTVTKNDGHLLFIINDGISEDSLVNQMLWMDNIGFLSAQIIINKK